MSNNPGFILYILTLVLPIFLLIAYVTIVMMDRHSKEKDDE